MTLSCDDCALSNVCLPAGISDEEIALLEEKILASVRIRKGESLYKAGDIFSALFAVKSGSFKSILSDKSGQEQIVGFHTPGELIGFDGFGSSHASTVLALENSMYCKIPDRHLSFLCSNIEDVSKHIHAMVASEVQALNTSLLFISQKSAEERIVSFMQNMSDRYKKRGFSPTHFFLSMTRGDIANFLGMAPETISRLLAQLQEEGLVELHRREVNIKDSAELARRAYR